VAKSPYMTNDFKIEVARYALKDTKATFRLWKEHGHKMPDNEWRISKMTRTMGMRGVPVRMEKLREAEAKLIEEKRRAETLLPWIGGDYPPLSLQAIRDECDKQGIPKPASFAEKNPEGAAWEAEFADRFPWVRGVRDYRKANKHLKAVQTMIARTRPDGRMPYELKYFGATTGRDSGGGGWNCQNIPKGEVAGVDIRNLIEAPDGYTFIICDLAQIEARCLPYLAKDEDTLNLLRSGIDIYEAHARSTMGYADPRPLKQVDPHLRFVAKARCLAGSTPILTERGYFTAAELTALPCLRVWDGVEWVEYEKVIYTGQKAVSQYRGEHFTEDHEIFTGPDNTRQIGEIFKWDEGKSPCPLLRRNTPSEGWADVWLLACFVGRSLAKEWTAISSRALHRLWSGLREGLAQYQKWKVAAMRGLRDQKVEGDQGFENLGTPYGRPGSSTQPKMGCDDAKMLRPIKSNFSKLWWARNQGSPEISQ